MSDTKTVYVPGSSVKARQTTFGEVLKLSFKIEELQKIAKQFKNEKGYLNLEIVPRKEASQYGETHSVKVDTWKPKEGEQGQKPASKPAAKPKTPEPEAAADDDIPF